MMSRRRRTQAFPELIYPGPAPGWYHFANAPSTVTATTLGNNTLRIVQCFLARAVTIIRLSCEFSAAGDAASVYRLGVYACNKYGEPGTLALDAGTISTGTGNAGDVATGGVPGVYEIVCNLYVQRGWYAFGGVVQNAPGVQPTMRSLNVSAVAEPVPTGSVIGSPGAGIICFGIGGITGALPASCPSASGGAPRISFKVA